MTNGEKILQTFPKSRVEFIEVVTRFLIDGYCYEFSKSWWDQEYEELDGVEE